MPPKKAKAAEEASVQSYRYDATRKNIPPAGLAASGKIAETPKLKFAYNPHLPPVLRSDPSGAADALPELLAVARKRALTDDEARLLADALRRDEPWLEWAGKREKKGFEVDPVALHIHERVSAEAILRVAQSENIQRSLFADPDQEYRQAVQFYRHDVDWANRLILGDSLQVMASLARREDLAGKVQMIYMDPPYGIRFGSNFQSEIGKRDVKDKESDLTREPEMIKAYRDTWTLGVHSYLAYLRDRLLLCRELLTDSGSIFVQISDENLHRVRMVMDEVFGVDNFAGIITFRKTTGQEGFLLPDTNDYLLWYARDKNQIKFRELYQPREGFEWVNYDFVSLLDGTYRKMTPGEKHDPSTIPSGGRVYRRSPLTSTSSSEATLMPVEFNGKEFKPGKGGWKTNSQGFARLKVADRLEAYGVTLSYRRYTEDFPFFPMSNAWTDTASGGYGTEKIFVVQTNPKIIARCLLMTTDPGDLVLDPTCGSGTTAYVAEQRGRRWITIDTSRVALSLARQRILTAAFPFYRIKEDGADGTDDGANPAQGFKYKTVPHITLKSIAQNAALDAIFAKHQPVLGQGLQVLNAALKTVTPEVRTKLKAKLAAKEKQAGKKAITDADRRRWLLPATAWQEWEVPFDADEEWSLPLQDALTAYRAAWRAKMDEVNAAISANAEQEELVDQPEVVKGVVRVTGPFTVEAVMPAEEALDGEAPIGGAPEEMESFATDGSGNGADEPANAEAYLDKMLKLLRTDGVRFPNNKVLKFTRLDSFSGEYLHAEGEWEPEAGEARRVAVSFGPEHGPVTAYQVEKALRVAHRRGYDDLVFAGFSFDAAAQAVVEEEQDDARAIRCHLAHIRPDVAMDGLLKETPNSQIFTVFGSPRTELQTVEDGQFMVEMQGVDIYNPVDNTIMATNADKVAAWFVDTDYDGRTFLITQAFFPDKSAWDKLARVLKGVVDEERFAAFGGTRSLSFPAGEHRRVAVKVIDPRGNEVMRVHRLDDKLTY